MPICQRCGKVLCSNQALQYHLNKKFKCINNSCEICKNVFNSRLLRDAHLKYCKAAQIFKAFCKVEDDHNVFVLDHQMNIVKAKDPSLIDSTFICEMHSSPFANNIVVRNNIMFSVTISYVQEYMVAVQRPIISSSAT